MVSTAATQIRIEDTGTCGPTFTFFFDGRYDTSQIGRIYKDTQPFIRAEPVPAQLGGPWLGPVTVIPWPIQ